MSTYAQATKKIAIAQFFTMTSCVKQHPFLTGLPLLILTLGALYRLNHQATKTETPSADKPKQNSTPASSESEREKAPISLSGKTPQTNQGKTTARQNDLDDEFRFTFEVPEVKQAKEPAETPSESATGKEQAPLASQDKSLIAVLKFALEDEQSNSVSVIEKQVLNLDLTSIPKLYNQSESASKQKLIAKYLSSEQLAYLAIQLHKNHNFRFKFHQALIKPALNADRLTDFFQKFSKAESLTATEKQAFFQEVFPSYDINTKSLHFTLKQILIKAGNEREVEVTDAKLMQRYESYQKANEANKPQAAKGVIDLLTTFDSIKAAFIKFEGLRPYFIRFLSKENLTKLLVDPDCLLKAQEAIKPKEWGALSRKDSRLIPN